MIAACKPYGKVRLSSERWNASCSQGADIGDTVIIDAIERPDPDRLSTAAASAPGDLAGSPLRPPEGRLRMRCAEVSDLGARAWRDVPEVVGAVVVARGEQAELGEREWKTGACAISAVWIQWP